MDKSDYVMVGAYVAMCVGGLLLYKKYLESMEEKATANADEIFTHIEKVVEQKLTEAAVAEVAKAQ